MLPALDDIHALLETELGREPTGDPAVLRAAESVFAFAVDHVEIPQAGILESLEHLILGGTPELAGAARAAKRMFGEDENLELLTRERVLLRRGLSHENALALARRGDLEGLRRLPASTLRLALNAAKPNEAAPIIQAWALMPLYEREHT
jgi:hypothetical protein